MNCIDMLDKKIGKYAPKNLIYFILAMNVLGYIINSSMLSLYSKWLCLDIEKILQGQIWRIITWLMYAPKSFIMFLLLGYIYFQIGTTLEKELGTFKFDLYYISGILIHVLVCIVIYAITGISYSYIVPDYLYLSMFLFYSLLFPDRIILFLFIIPIKSKFIALINICYYLFIIIRGIKYLIMFDNIINYISYQTVFYYISDGIAAFSSLILFTIFYFICEIPFKIFNKNNKHIKYNKEKNIKNNKEFSENINVNDTVKFRHCCEICKRTDISDNDLEFRYCSKCNGIHEYCMTHLYSHEHKC